MNGLRRALSVGLTWLIVVQTAWSAQAETLSHVTPPQPLAETAQAPAQSNPPPLKELMGRSSLEIATVAEKFAFDGNEIRTRTEALKKESKGREATFKAAAKSGEKLIEQKERELAKLKGGDKEAQKTRKRIQCEIAKIRTDLTEKTYSFLQAEIASDVEISKLTLLAAWKSENQQLEQKIANGTIRERPFGDVINVGNRSTRKPFKGQEDDQKWGQREIEDARTRNLFPQEIKDPVLTEYVNRLANNLARNSDLHVPLKTYLVQKELKKDGRPVLGKDGQPEQVANAMALPGGFLVIYAGVILESENESELAGVVAHEMSHCAARHANRMQNKGRTFGIIQLATTIGLQIFAPGLFYAASYLTYYLKGLLLQAIFQGMGLVFTIDALGVSREFELEADQLGMQYAWKSGYDPEGFIRLFDHMSQKEGYASHTSFFATHPAYGDRILNSLKEYKALRAASSPQQQFLTDTSEFQEIKERLKRSLHMTEKEVQKDLAKPSLRPSEPPPEECDQILKAAPTTPPASAAPKGQSLPRPENSRQPQKLAGCPAGYRAERGF